jgi:CBS domain containing-hemolysin-like protein
MEIPAGIGLAAVAVLVVANGFFVATEFALVAVRRSRIEQLAEEGNRTAVAAKDLIAHLDAYIAACQLGITMASLALGWIGEPAMVRTLERPVAALGIPFSPHTVAVGITFALITALHIVIGELAPKGIALQRPEGTTLFVTHPIRLFYRAFSWPIRALNAIGNGVLRLFGFRAATGHEMVHSAEELALLVNASEEAGTVEPSEARIATRAFRFADLTAAELMTPRPDFVGVPVRIEARALLARAEHSPYSRLIVHDGGPEHVVGTVRVRDLLRLQPTDEDVDLRTRLRPCPVVPASKAADELLEEMRRSGEPMTAIVDEFGSTVGVITVNDLVEALVGPINEDARAPEIGPVEKDGSRVFSGALRLADFEEAAGLVVDEEEAEHADTLNGLVMTKLGRLPQAGDVIAVGGRKLRVETVQRRRVARARLLPSTRIPA